jgi:lipid-A-disaccharide synthase
MKSEYRILVIAGEASADQLCSLLVQKLKVLLPGAHFVGVGGDLLIKEGLETIIEAKQISVVGLTDWLGRAQEVFAGLKKVKDYVKKNTFDLAILVDLPDFNFRIAKILKEKKIPTYYYIAPQVWATRQYRAKKIKQLFDKVFVIFPFEEDFYYQYQVETIFIGHPLLDIIERKTHYRTHSEITQAPQIALLPGSRKSEILHHAKVCREVCLKLLEKYPTAKIILPIAPTLDESLVKEHFGDLKITLSKESSHKIVRESDLAFVASGTATLETAMIGTPHCLFYKMSGLTTFYLRKIAKYTGFFGLANILFQKEVIKEFCLEKCQSEAIAKETFQMIENEIYRKAMIEKLKELPNLLGEKGATDRAAQYISNELRTV